jgi:hypothetical protein
MTLISCPYCDAFGLMVGSDGEASPCPISGYAGYLEMPLTRYQADFIYSACPPAHAACNLVNQEWSDD